MRLLALALNVALAIALTGALASIVGAAAGDPRVLVSDDKVLPKEAHVRVGQTLEWRNTGQQQHRVVSDSGEWGPFNLLPSGRHETRFARAGRFPYTVDGTLKGVILVEGGGAGGPTPKVPPEAQVPPGLSVRVLRFTATLTASGSDFRETEGTERYLNDTKVEWSGTWPDVVVRLVESRGQIDIYPGMDRATPSTGEITVTLGFHHVWPGSRPHDCTGSLTQKKYPAVLWINGRSTKGGNSRVEINAGPRGPGGPYDPEIVTMAHQRCDNAFPFFAGRREFVLDPQLLFTHDTGKISVTIRRMSGPEKFFPLDRILAHQAFEFDIGQQREERDRTRWEWRGKMEFRPR